MFELKIIFMTRLCHPLFDSVSIRNVFRCVDTLFEWRHLRRQKNTISYLLLEIDAHQCFISLSTRSLLTKLIKETMYSPNRILISIIEHIPYFNLYIVKYPAVKLTIAFLSILRFKIR